MKRYISAILIPCLLLQLFGCYSWRVVETPEPGTRIKIYTKTDKVLETENWRYADGKFIGVTSYSAAEVETMIGQQEINKIEERYFNELKTGICVISCLAIVVSTILIIKNNIIIDMGGGN